mmetsp:Transcript_16734/g.19362  ORF Transcript_16734/g.19362 Transcript_16734/m.19362 type:complete len:333 (-) Transcript_16734:80-1078(-)
MALEVIGIGFGTAGLGASVFQSVALALEAGFRKFDTAEENDYWYDQAAVGNALSNFFLPGGSAQECVVDRDDVDCYSFCAKEGLKISTKIPPWELVSIANIRQRAAKSRETLVGFCDAFEGGEDMDSKYPLDVYYIHAPKCWDGWHTRCKGERNTLPLREAWLGMEAVAHDKNAERIGLSNVNSHELMDIIQFVEERKANFDSMGDHGAAAAPRIPDVVQAYADPIHPATELRNICKKYGIEFVSYSTLGTQHHMRGQGNPVLENEHVQELAVQYNRSTAEVVLSWAMHHNDMSVIPRSSKKHHIQQLARLLNDEPFLTKNDLQLIDAMSLN